MKYNYTPQRASFREEALHDLTRGCKKSAEYRAALNYTTNVKNIDSLEFCMACQYIDDAQSCLYVGGKVSGHGHCKAFYLCGPTQGDWLRYNNFNYFVLKHEKRFRKVLNVPEGKKTAPFVTDYFEHKHAEQN